MKNFTISLILFLAFGCDTAVKTAGEKQVSSKEASISSIINLSSLDKKSLKEEDIYEFWQVDLKICYKDESFSFCDINQTPDQILTFNCSSSSSAMCMETLCDLTLDDKNIKGIQTVSILQHQAQNFLLLKGKDGCGGSLNYNIHLIDASPKYRCGLTTSIGFDEEKRKMKEQCLNDLLDIPEAKIKWQENLACQIADC